MQWPIAARVLWSATMSVVMLIADKLSKLNYVPVCIKGIGGVHDALHDSGSEVNLIQRDVLRELTYLPSQGRVKIKGVVGPAVETDVVLLDLSPFATDDNCVYCAAFA
jgi:hypothetical protein